jgi:nucleotide-binding universal stress UspA family protein
VVNVRQSDSAKDRRYLDEPEVEQLSGRLAGTGVTFEVQQLVGGKEPAEEIVDAAERLKANLVVIGIRRTPPTGKLLFGS